MMRGGNYLNRGGGAAARLGRKYDKANNFWGTTIRLFRYLRNDRWGVIFSLVIAVISVILSVQAPKILGEATTVIFSGFMSTSHAIDYGKVWGILEYVIFIYLVSFVFGVLQQQIMTRISQRAVYRLRKEFKAKMATLPVSYYDTHNNGDIMSRMVNDMDNISGTLNQTLIQTLTSALQFIGVVYFMLTINIWLAIVAFVTVPLSAGLMRVIAPRSQRFFAAQQRNLGLLNNQIEENYAGHTIVKTFNHEKTTVENFEAQNEKFYDAAWKANFVSTIIFPTMRFLNNLDYLAMAVVGGLMVVAGQVNIGGVQAMLQYSNQFSQPIAMMSNMLNTIQQTIASAERIFEVLDSEEMKDFNSEHQEIMDKGLHSKLSPDSPEMTVESAAEARTTGNTVDFEQVAFSYVPEQPLMTDYSMAVKDGEMVAIVGPTGAGKTTMINLLERFYETTSGTIRLKGVDTKAMTREDLRSHFAMVLQETWLFEGTIMENLRYGKLDATDDEVIEAAKNAHADSFITTLPEGYQTILNANASNISQGQRQLLTIARAFLANPEILILDEATSSVDTRTERLIQSAMARLLTGRTSFVVAHRLSTIRDADQILVMAHGNIVEKGKHDELLKLNGMYAGLYNSQFAEG
ncbi:MAG: ABC transporter ATP-binding protein/permease [Streptococcaceae bacterium]|jgi:ATP-binding cassette subfamily B protein|nr:ABC transporter ATP-binding protein/permease [Streptococcaceae bacterium]